MSAILALQKAIRSRLVGVTAVTDLVPAGSILDRHAHPAPMPSIIIGEDQSVQDVGLSRNRQRVYSTLHIWKTEPSSIGAKAIASAIRAAIHSELMRLEPGFHCADCFVADMRFLRNPDGETSHGIVTLESIVGAE